MTILKNYWNDHPLLIIMGVALFVRILAAFFSQGYGMHDDHFGPIEQPFLIMTDYSFWEARGEPHGHSVFYPSLHYFAFETMESAGISDPKDKMLIIRLLHAIYSLLTVYFGYRIALHLSDKKTAGFAGLLLALFWFQPFLSVRNLIEVVAVPPVMAGFWLALRSRNKSDFLFSGLAFGFAFIFRYQTALFPLGIIIAFLYQKKFTASLLICAGFIITVTVVQGATDFLAWGWPFAAPITYFLYNASHGTDYTSGPWYQYLALIAGLLILPNSLMIFWGYLKTSKSSFPIFLSIGLFLLFHSAFPNKQERFIFPMIPILITAGIAQWQLIARGSAFWIRRARLLKFIWLWFWIINIILLAVMTFTYSKRSRCEAMYYLSKKADVKALYISSGRLGSIKPPLFYLNKNVSAYSIDDSCRVQNDENDSKRHLASFTEPNFIVFFGRDDLSERVALFTRIKQKGLVFETEIDPSLIDNLLYWLNPVGNKNTSAFIYRIQNNP